MSITSTLPNVGIVVLDLFGEKQLENCLESIPENVDVLILSNTERKTANIIHPNATFRHFNTETTYGTLKNIGIRHFKFECPKSYVCFVHSNVVLSRNFFDVLSISRIYGISYLTGSQNGKLLSTIEDEDTKLNLEIYNRYGTTVELLLVAVTNVIGYFDERYFEDSGIEIYDYIMRLRASDLYICAGYYPQIPILSYKVDTTVENSKIGHILVSPITQNSKKVMFTYGLFQHKFKFIPEHNDPPAGTQEKLLEDLEFLQNTYGKKQ